MQKIHKFKSYRGMREYLNHWYPGWVPLEEGLAATDVVINNDGGKTIGFWSEEHSMGAVEEPA